jgi:hypothetical protein
LEPVLSVAEGMVTGPTTGTGTWCFFTATATMRFTADGVYDKDPRTEERSNAKVCAVSRTERIANRVGRSSGQMTPRRTTYLDPKGRGDKSMSRLLAVGVKRRTAEDVYAGALQRLSDMAKAGIA